MKSLKILLLFLLIFSVSACSLDLNQKKEVVEDYPSLREMPIDPDFTLDSVKDIHEIRLGFPVGMEHFEENFFFNLPEGWEYFIDDNNQLVIRTIDTEDLVKAGKLFPGYADNIVVKYYKTVEDINIVDINSKSKEPLKRLSDIFVSSASDLSKLWEFTGNTYLGNYQAYEFINGGYGQNYAIIVATDLGVYEFQFLRAADKSSLSEIEKQILDSIKFPVLIYEQ